jgi:hypothetical protein
METYESFADFVRAVVLPLQKQNPDWIRLDGQRSGGSQNAAGYFHHNGRRWKVDEDTRFGPLLLAYHHFEKTGEDAFQESRTKRRRSLVLIESLFEEHKRAQQRFKYMYIYAPQ